MPTQVHIENVLVIGAGIMGSGIAQVTAASSKFKSVILQDISQDQLEKAISIIRRDLLRLAKKDPSLDVEEVLSRITFTTTMSDVDIGSGLLVIEAVPEKMDLKQEIFRKLYQKFGHDDRVILTTNTSSLPCKEIGIHVHDKSRFGGLHFSNPVALMKLVEVIHVKETSQATLDILQDFSRDINKIPVICRDSPGFIVNRLLIPLLYTAVEMVEKGHATTEDIDIAMKLACGFPMGPFEILDFVGIDTANFVGQHFMSDDGEVIVKPSRTLELMVKEGKLGRKSGSGFYNYKEK